MRAAIEVLLAEAGVVIESEFALVDAGESVSMNLL